MRTRAYAAGLQHHRDDGAVMDGVAHDEDELTADARPCRDHGAVTIELCLYLDLAVEHRGIQAPHRVGQLGERSRRDSPVRLDVGPARAPIVGAHTGVRGGEKGRQVIETMSNVSPDAPRRTAGCWHRVVRVIELVDQSPHLVQETDETLQQRRGGDRHHGGQAKEREVSHIPINGISLRRRTRIAALETNTTSARTNSKPPSPWTSMPSTVR